MKPDERHNDEPDEVTELRALYRGLQPPLWPEELEDADPETARAVAWMQTAWRAVEAPPATLPRAARPPATVRVSRRARLFATAAAAALLAWGTAALWPPAAVPGVRTPDPGDLAQAPPPVAPAPVSAPSPAAAPAAVEVLSARPDRLELRSGPVRLLLLAPPTEPVGAPSGG